MLTLPTKTNFEDRAQQLIKAVIPDIANYLRDRVAPSLLEDGAIEISKADFKRVTDLLGSCITQFGLPVLPEPPKLSMSISS